MDPLTPLSSENFDFIAFSCALSRHRGEPPDIHHITALMSAENKAGFLRLYQCFLTHLTQGECADYETMKKIILEDDIIQPSSR